MQQPIVLVPAAPVMPGEQFPVGHLAAIAQQARVHQRQQPFRRPIDAIADRHAQHPCLERRPAGNSTVERSAHQQLLDRVR